MCVCVCVCVCVCMKNLSYVHNLIIGLKSECRILRMILKKQIKILKK